MRAFSFIAKYISLQPCGSTGTSYKLASEEVWRAMNNKKARSGIGTGLFIY